MIGTTLNHYKVLERLGSGGMGEVYLAEDTRLKRKVALKILPAGMASDPERRGRFAREAEAVASLNHPNIITIYSVEESGGVHFITMELVHGRTLREMIPAKGLSLARFFDCAVPMADAVSAAHKRGITHRDLKPDNVMYGDDGRVKILDFGLAKLTDEPPAAPANLAPTVAPTAVPTALHPQQLTSEGKVMGTVAYMSPEQAEGRPVDHRSDIFSLGVILYQMATGSRPFEGDTRMSILTAILRDAPRSVTDVNPGLPRHLGRIVKRCLAKDPEERYQTAQDLKNDLIELRRETESGAVEPAAGSPAAAQPALGGRRAVIGLAAAAVLLVAAIAWLLLRPARPPAAEAPAIHGTFTQLTDQAGEEVAPSLSPDGRMIAYASGPQGRRDIYVQSVGGRNAVDVTKGSDVNDDQPAYSPDGQRIAFRSERDGGGIFVMGVLGDSVVRLTGEGFHPAWSPDGREIAYDTEGWTVATSRSSTSQIRAVNVETRQTRTIFAGDGVQPSWSPRGTRIAYWAVLGGSGQRDLWTVPAAGGEPVPITNDTAVDWNPVWSPDGRFVYFISDRDGNMNIWRVPMDEETGRVGGALQPVSQAATGEAGDLRVSADGSRLVYASTVVTQNIQKYPIDPAGAKVTGDPVWITRGSEHVDFPDPSPDGQWLAFQVSGKQEDIWVSRADGSERRRLTNDAARDRLPRWAPDGKSIAFYSDRSGAYQIWRINPDGTGLKPITDDKNRTAHFSVWSPDGQRMIVTPVYADSPFMFDPGKSMSEQKPETLPPHHLGPGTYYPWSWSPDGRTISGIVLDGGKYDSGTVLYDPAAKTYRRLTDRGGLGVWLSDSRHLAYSDFAGGILVVDAVTGQTHPLLSVAPDQVEPFSLAVGRDGRSLYFTRINPQSDLWMLSLR